MNRIQKHARFWDKTNKGYITPLDTISGFITLGYSMVFSIALGAFVGVFLSLSTQSGWFPDPLCRSNVRNLIRAKKQTQSNTGAFDDNGVFNIDKFDLLFKKYAKSDKTGNSITLVELIGMTKEQEKLGSNIKAWATSFIELSTAYFFIGHRGSLTKDDVRAAYDGSLFYRLTDENRLRIEDKSSGTILKGPYLSKSTSMLSPKALEHKLEVLLSSLQSKSSLASEYGLNEWISYVQEKTDKIKKHALRRPTSIINGVTTPKYSVHRKEETAHSDPSDLFPNGLTGVAKEEGKTTENLVTEDYLSGLLSHSGSAELSERSINSNAYASMSTSGILTVNASSIKHSPEDTIDEEEPLMSGVLRPDDHTPATETLTGVQNGDVKKAPHHESNETKEDENLASLSPSASSLEDSKATKENEKSDTENEVPEPTITPPPEEKQPEKIVNKANSNGKKNKKKNKQGNNDIQPGQQQATIYS